jgi:hypothetical protein
VKKAIIALIAVIGIAFPATAGAGTFKGIVVSKQSSRHALVVASKTGKVRTVHTDRLATRVGTRVAVNARRLPDGTFSAKRVKPTGHARTAKIRGVVARRTTAGFLISAGHSVIAVRTHRSFSLNGTGSGPKPGDIVVVTVGVGSNGELDEDNVEHEGQAQQVELAGSVVSVTPATSSADGEIVLKVGKSSIDVVVPAGTTLPTLNPGDSVRLKVELSGDTFTLVQSQHENDDEGDDDGNNGDGDHDDGDHGDGGGDHHG